MSRLRVVVSGSSGRMGQELKSLIASMPEQFELLGEIHRNAKFDISAKNCDVVVDFSLPELLQETLDACLLAKVPLVSGTTGLSTDQQKSLRRASAQIPIFWAPNMSVGVAVFRKMIAQLKSVKNYDFHIHEVHHNQKKDKPSGTAVLLHESLRGAIGHETEITSERGGGVFGIHTVHVMGPEETLAITHQALNRAVFARGALQAAQWLVGQVPGLYGMDDLLS